MAQKHRVDVAGNTQSNRNNLYSDYQEISPWNANYMQEYKHVRKPMWRYFSGTMSDFHHFLQKYPWALVFFGFLRSCGMFYGISNPLMGFCSLAAALIDSWYNLVFLAWSVIISMLACFTLRVPRELIYNGLYPSQGIIIGYAMYVTYGADSSPYMFMQLIAMIPICFFNIIFFEALCSVFVKKLGVTPMMVSGLTLGMFWHLAIQKSYHFSSPYTAPPTLGPFTLKAQAIAEYNLTDLQWNTTNWGGHIWFNVSAYNWLEEILYGVAMLQFSTSRFSAIPICIGLFCSSPIMFATTWWGSFVGISTLVLLMPQWDFLHLRLGLYGINASITMSVLVGNFFVLNPASVILGTLSTMVVTFLCMAFQSFCAPFGIPYFAYPATIVCIICYMTAGSFPSLVPVELVSLTVPEDHLRRYWLSMKIINELHMGSKLVNYKDLSPQKLQSIERSMLPVLLCSYTKLGNAKKIEELLNLGADPNYSDYDGRCAIHIAACEDREEIIKILLRWNANINIMDNYDSTALADALNAKHYRLAKFIHMKGGKIFLPEERLASKLCYMVYNSELECIKIWLQCGANPSVCDYDNRTPLHIAYSRQNKEIIDLLELHRANKEVKDRWGMMPSECLGSLVIDNPTKKSYLDSKYPYQPLLSNRNVSQHMDAELISTVLMGLLQNESDKDMKQALVPSLVCALVYMQEHATLANLVHMDFDLRVLDYDNRTPLHIACSVGDLETVKLLIWNKAEVNALDRFGYSPLFEAVQHKRDHICKHLRQSGSALCLTKEMEVSTLCWAVYNNDFDMITRMVENGIDIEAADYDDRTCRDIATDLENQNMSLHIESLLKRQKKMKDRDLVEKYGDRANVPRKHKKKHRPSDAGRQRDEGEDNGDVENTNV